MNADKNRIARLDLADLRRFVIDYPEAAAEHKDLIKDRLASFAWDLGDVWDRIEGTNPLDGPAAAYGGTPNHRSMTYKFRKLAGYSYP